MRNLKSLLNMGADEQGKTCTRSAQKENVDVPSNIFSNVQKESYHMRKEQQEISNFKFLLNYYCKQLRNTRQETQCHKILSRSVWQNRLHVWTRI